MEAKKKKKLEDTYERILKVGFCIVPYEDISDIIGPDPMVYGTAKDERILSFEGVEALFRFQYEQMETMKPAYDRKRIALRISNDGNNACIIEEITLTLSSDEEIHTIFMRATCVMEYLDNQWKLTHWHTSIPVDTENDPWHMEEWKREKEKLQQLVDQQTTTLKQNIRELQIEAALERVRARTMAMQRSDELMEASLELFTQLKSLGELSDQFSIAIFDEDKQTVKVYATLDGEKFDEPFEVNMDSHLVTSALWKNWKSNKKSMTFDLSGESLASYNSLRNSFISSKGEKAFSGDRWVIHVAFFSHGFLSFSSAKHHPQETINLLERFARQFEQTYTRFMDLQKAEAQAVRAGNDLIAIKAARLKAEEALSELKATQAQLVQQEKLASLGQLTAGIAHEIKNPLNFVNNFSEVSVEMIEETRDELSGLSDQISDTDKGKITEALIILADIESNLRKIHEHGTRANGIVSSMLQHSRGGTGKMEPTDLNALIKEYVNLSFHGMRANKNPINVELQLDLDDSMGQVNLIGEDFSRVILNLCNNAFDAMRTKVIDRPDSALSYLPKLMVRTFKEENEVHISVRDNGPGIPDEIIDKILQPFFTTKKGTEGTGLGLSITHDIVKAHGGTFAISNNMNSSGAEFNITSPFETV